ncbi:MAG TPA: hypothetical protein VG838_12250 [Opitutaceae bacterium]|nr:hypothetical protein [Opitutaceae bacterium]
MTALLTQIRLEGSSGEGGGVVGIRMISAAENSRIFAVKATKKER